MPEDGQRAVNEEGELRQAVQPAPALEAAEQMDEQDALPHLHDLTVGLTVASPVPEAFVDPQRIGGVEGAALSHGHCEAPSGADMLIAAVVLVRARLVARVGLSATSASYVSLNRVRSSSSRIYIVERVEQRFAERVLRGDMFPRHHVAARQRRIDRCGLLGLPEGDRIDGPLFVEAVEFGEVYEHAGHGAVADARTRVAVDDWHLGIAAVDGDDEFGHALLDGRGLPRYGATAVDVC